MFSKEYFKRKKYHNLIFITFLVFISLIIIIFNKQVDPYNLKNLGNELLYTMPDCKKLVYTHINCTRQNKYDYILIGSSNTLGIIGALSKYSDKKTYYLVLENMSFAEVHDVLKYYFKVHPETKNVLYSLEYGPFIMHDNDSYGILQKPPGKFADFINLFFSLSATEKSIHKVILLCHQKFNQKNEKNIKRENIIDTGTNIKFSNNYYLYNKKRRYYSNVKTLYKNINKFKKIYELLNQKNLNVIYFIPPVNALYLISNYNCVELFKRNAVRITPFYDYTFINDYTIKPIGYYFIDVVHANYDFFGNEISQLLLFNKMNEKYTVYITPDNINTVLKHQKDMVDEYIKNNKKYVNSYLKLYSEKYDDEQCTEKMYRDDEYKSLQKSMENKL